LNSDYIWTDAIKCAEALTVLQFPRLKVIIEDVTVNGVGRKVVVEGNTFNWCEGDGEYVIIYWDKCEIQERDGIIGFGVYEMAPIERVKAMINLA
jgi:hypothetical protein